MAENVYLLYEINAQRKECHALSQKIKQNKMLAPDDGVKEGIDGGFVVGFVEITGELVGVPGRGCTTGFPLMIEDGEVLKFLISLCICWGYSKQS